MRPHKSCTVLVSRNIEISKIRKNVYFEGYVLKYRGTNTNTLILSQKEQFTFISFLSMLKNCIRCETVGSGAIPFRWTEGYYLGYLNWCLFS